MEALTLINARIFTMDAGSAEASGLIIEDGKIIRTLTGSSGKEPPAQGNFLDLGGRVILPGLINKAIRLIA